MISKLDRRRRASARRQQITMPQEVPAPYGGLNTRDALNAMQPTDAVRLDNWFPTEGSVTVRPGKTALSDTGTGSAIEAIYEFFQQGDRMPILCSGNEIYRGNADPAVSISDAGSPYTNNRWVAVNFNGVMPMVNGADAPRQWDGSSMTTPAWTGPTIATLAGVAVHKFRLYFWTNDDQSFWYAAPNAIAGALTEFDLSRVTALGGNLINVASWTMDSGAGPDDYICFIFSSGQIVVYQGDDPGTAANWAIVGVYSMPEPIGGDRCAVKVGGDLKIVTKADFVSMTQTVQQGFENVPRTKLSGAIRASASIHSSSFGWGAQLHPEGHMLIINQPDYNSTYNQFVMNTSTGAWARFTGLNPQCWGRYNGKMVMGGQDGVLYSLSGRTDDGAAIYANGLQAWSTLGLPFDKLAQQARPIITAEGSINYSLGVGFDFEEISETTQVAASSTGTPWGSPWGSPWSASGLIFKTWQSISGEGQYVSANLVVSAKQEISWLKTDYRMTPIKNT